MKIQYRYLLTITFCLWSTTTISSEFVPDNECALIVASRQTIGEVNEYIATLDDTRHLAVYKSQNGWYAISIGTLEPHQIQPVMSKWKSQGKIPYDSFCSKGTRFTDKLTITRGGSNSNRPSDQSSYSNYGNTTSSCDGIDIDQEKIACYALIVGPKACTQAVSEDSPHLASTISQRIGLSAACTAGVKSAFAGQYVADDLVWNIADELWETGCSKMSDDSAGLLTKLFIGIPSCVSSGASWVVKLSAAERCVKKIEAKCGE